MNLNQNTEEPMISDHVLLVHLNKVDRTIKVYDANRTPNQIHTLQKNLKQFLETKIGGAKFTLTRTVLRTLEDGCAVAAMFALVEILQNRTPFIPRNNRVKFGQPKRTAYGHLKHIVDEIRNAN